MLKVVRTVLCPLQSKTLTLRPSYLSDNTLSDSGAVRLRSVRQSERTWSGQTAVCQTVERSDCGLSGSRNMKRTTSLQNDRMQNLTSIMSRAFSENSRNMRAASENASASECNWLDLASNSGH
ncbi:hypothetical protein M8J76_012010 [Diaphorina citri]|nr:hypothetical protein M8J76_012010 [Diaphorina citri]